LHIINVAVTAVLVSTVAVIVVTRIIFAFLLMAIPPFCAGIVQYNIISLFYSNFHKKYVQIMLLKSVDYNKKRAVESARLMFRLKSTF